MHIIGLNFVHADAAACVVSDGRVVAAVAEERFGRRIKHQSGFPELAVQEVLRIAGLKLSDIDVVAIGSDRKANRAAKAAYALKHPVNAIGHGATTYRNRLGAIQGVGEELMRATGTPASECHFEVVPVEHHVAHIASSYFGSTFDEAAAFSYDASGDFVSAMYGRCTPAGVDVLKRVFLPDSLGLYYTALCQFIGFDSFGEEYKVMGLAAYGTPEYMPVMQKMLRVEPNGGFSLHPDFFRGLAAQTANESGEVIVPTLYTEALEAEFGPPRQRGTEITARDRNIAASCQKHFEDVVLQCLSWLHTQVPVDTLVAAGGCALNGVCNARILRESPFKKTYIHCAAGDDGTAVGAALYAWHQRSGGKRPEPMAHASLGPEHSEDEIRQALAAAGLEAKRYSRDELVANVADLLAQGKVVGWYQGRSEWGPRALGNRSILAHPGWPGIKDLINEKIKRREAFRPFAPSILADRVPEYFESDVSSPFMMHVVAIKQEKRGELSGVTHHDGTGRLHTVTREQNALYYDLISAFAERTGTPVVLNTSFNENEPIVDTPAQAVDCFLRNDFDVLCMGPFVTMKTRAHTDSTVARAQPIAMKA